MFKKIGLVLSVVLFVLAGCGGGGGRSNDPAKLTAENVALALKQAVNATVLPAVDGFATQADAFKSESDTFCAALDESALAALQADWESLFKQWYKLVNYKFGPLINNPVVPEYLYVDSFRQRGNEYTETVRESINADLTSGDALNDAHFAAKPFTEMGLLALEVLIYETASGDHSGSAAAIVSEYQSNPRKCDILKGVANQLVVRANGFQQGWKSDYQNSGTSYGDQIINGTLDSGETVTLLLTTIQEFLEHLQSRNAATNIAQLSGLSWQAISASIDEIETLLQGTATTTQSFFSIINETGATGSVDVVRANIAEIREALVNQNAATLEIALGKLDGNFKREIPNGLDIELGINFTDGD